MVKFTVCFGKIERHSYKAISNGYIVDRTYMDKEARLTYPLDIRIEGVSSKTASDMFDSWLNSFETRPVFKVFFDDEAGVLYARVLVPKFDPDNYNPSIQRSEVLSTARAKAKEVKKAYAA